MSFDVARPKLLEETYPPAPDRSMHMDDGKLGRSSID